MIQKNNWKKEDRTVLFVKKKNTLFPESNKHEYIETKVRIWWNSIGIAEQKQDNLETSVCLRHHMQVLKLDVRARLLV